MLIGLIASIAANVALLAVVAIQRTDRRIMEAMHEAEQDRIGGDAAGAEETIEALRSDLEDECGWNQDLRAEIEMMGRQMECQRAALAKIRDAVKGVLAR